MELLYIFPHFQWSVYVEPYHGAFPKKAAP